MTSFSTHLSPLVGSRIAVGPLDKVDALVYPLVHLAHRYYVLGLTLHAPTTVGTLTTYATRQNRQRLHTQILTELEVLKVSKTTTLVIAPCVLELTALPLWSDSGLPTIGIPEAIATTMNYASSRETHESWVKVGQCLSQILTQTMTLISILRHQRYYINIHIASGEYQYLQSSILAVGIRSEHRLKLFPVLIIHIKGSLCQEFWILWWPTLYGLYQYNTNLLGITNYVAHKSREIVLLASLYRDTVETVVLYADTCPTSIVVILLSTLDVEAHVVGIVRMNRILYTWLHIAK